MEKIKTHDTRFVKFSEKALHGHIDDKIYDLMLDVYEEAEVVGTTDFPPDITIRIEEAVDALTYAAKMLLTWSLKTEETEDAETTVIWE